MTQLMHVLLDRITFLHGETRKALDGLPNEALDWAPGPGMNSLCATVVHMLGAERYWLSDVACGVPSSRDRDAEFRSCGLSTSILGNMLDLADGFAEKALASLSEADLDTVRVSVQHGREFSVAWAVTHVIEHGAMHVGHVQIIRQVWEQARGVQSAEPS
jgi:uncharacterized damage-inducible protein DinB